jgi:transposase-like protein
MTKANEKQASEQRRGRPGRRSASDRLEAVRALLSGKASVEQLSQKYAVTQETIESWRAQGLEGLEASLRPGGASASTSREKELEREREQLKAALTRAVMEKELLQQALDLERKKRPTVPPRWRR